MLRNELHAGRQPPSPDDKQKKGPTLKLLHGIGIQLDTLLMFRQMLSEPEPLHYATLNDNCDMQTGPHDEIEKLGIEHCGCKDDHLNDKTKYCRRSYDKVDMCTMVKELTYK